MAALNKRIEALHYLGEAISSDSHEGLEKAIHKAHIENNWFTIENIKHSLQSIASSYLQKEKLESFVGDYQFDEEESKIVGLIPAGNIPLVGIHDMICIFLAGHISMIKFSQKDEVLPKVLIQILLDKFPEFSDSFLIVDRLAGFDAVIATGSDNTSRYFDYYFGKYPSIIRKNRNSIAVLKADDSETDLKSLADDVFMYFGLGCRNVSKLYLPKGFELSRIFEAWDGYNYLAMHHKYKNNLEYNNANLLLNQEPFLTNDVFILKEDEKIVSRISVIHYEYYHDLAQLEKNLLEKSNQLQCVASNLKFETVETIPFGSCQKPELNQFADGVDTLKFLASLQ